MDPLATVEDIPDLWRPLTETEIRPAEGLLRVASAVLRRRLPIDLMILDGRADPAVVRYVVIEMIKSAVEASNRPVGAKSISETASIYSHTITLDATARLELTDGLRDLLDPPETGRGHGGTIRTIPSLAPNGYYDTGGRS